MRSLIFSFMARVFFWLMLAASVVILFRGHDEPGGGFVGGLVAAMAVAILALAESVETARKRVAAHPMVLIGAGLGLAVLSGLPGLGIDGSFLAHQWAELPGGLKLGTTMVFDLGVYLVVFGGVVALVLRLYERDA